MTGLLTRPLEAEEFAALAPADWNRLAAGATRPCVFSTYEWLDSWWGHYGKAYGFHFLSVWEGARMIGALPLVRRFVAIEDGVIPVRVILLAGSLEVAPDQLDVMAESGRGGEVAGAIVDYLLANRNGWDLLHLSHIDADGLLGRALAGAVPASRRDTIRLSSAPYIRLQGDFNQYMHQTFRGKKRRQVDAWHRKVLDEGMQFRACQPGEERHVIHELFRLHGLRAGVKGISSHFHGRRLRDFHVALAARLGGAGMLNTLYVEKDGEILGVLYAFRLDGTVFWYQIGVDPRFARMSLGTVLVYELIRQSYEHGIAELDFLRGPGPHKSRWTETARPLSLVNVYNTSLAGTLQKVAYRGRRQLVRRVKALLPQTGAGH